MSSTPEPTTTEQPEPTTQDADKFDMLDGDTQLELVMSLLSIDSEFSKELRQKLNTQADSIQYITVNNEKRQVYTDKDGAKYYFEGIKSPRKKHLTSYKDKQNIVRPANASHIAIDQFNLINGIEPTALFQDPPSEEHKNESNDELQL